MLIFICGFSAKVTCAFLVYKKHFRSDLRFQGYHCKSGIAIFAWRVRSMRQCDITGPTLLTRNNSSFLFILGVCVWVTYQKFKTFLIFSIPLQLEELWLKHKKNVENNELFWFIFILNFTFLFRSLRKILFKG